MRITDKTREIIRQTTAEVFGVEAEVRLFGSRVDDDQKGGDLDLLVELPAPQEDARRRCLTFVARLQQRLGDQPIDVLVTDPQTPQLPIHATARSTGVPL